MLYDIIISFLEIACKIRFAILIAAFKSRSSVHNHIFENIINIPSLHVIGETDKVILPGTLINITNMYMSYDYLQMLVMISRCILRVQRLCAIQEATKCPQQQRIEKFTPTSYLSSRAIISQSKKTLRTDCKVSGLTLLST